MPCPSSRHAPSPPPALSLRLLAALALTFGAPARALAAEPASAEPITAAEAAARASGTTTPVAAPASSTPAPVVGASPDGGVALSVATATDGGTAAGPCGCVETKPAKLDHVVEFSFGTAQMFNGASQVVKQGQRILPTASALLLAEWLAGESWSVVAFFNLPLAEAKVIKDDGSITYAAADPVAALGLRWSPLRMDVLGGRARMETQLAAFAGTTIASLSGNAFVPVLAARLHLHDTTGLAISVGASWAFVKESLVLTYGLGYRF